MGLTPLYKSPFKVYQDGATVDDPLEGPRPEQAPRLGVSPEPQIQPSAPSVEIAATRVALEENLAHGG